MTKPLTTEKDERLSNTKPDVPNMDEGGIPFGDGLTERRCEGDRHFGEVHEKCQCGQGFFARSGFYLFDEPTQPSGDGLMNAGKGDGIVERIVGPAIRRIADGKVWSQPIPGSHFSVSEEMAADGAEWPLDRRVCDQGFITDGGRFVDRYEGYRIAATARQIVSHEPLDDPRRLFSEDLWDREMYETKPEPAPSPCPEHEPVYVPSNPQTDEQGEGK